MRRPPPRPREAPPKHTYVCVGCKRELRSTEVAALQPTGHGYFPVCHACRDARR